MAIGVPAQLGRRPTGPCPSPSLSPSPSPPAATSPPPRVSTTREATPTLLPWSPRSTPPTSLCPASLRPDALAVAAGELRPPRSLPPPSSCGRRALYLPHQPPRERNRTRPTHSSKEVTPASLPRLVAEEKGGGEKFWQPVGVTLNRTGAFETYKFSGLAATYIRAAFLQAVRIDHCL